MKIPEPYQVRLFQEYHDLRDKIEKLNLFTSSDKFTSLDPDEQSRLSHQLTYMELYLSILHSRILAIPF